jgi:FPC/CPF motif-containing protein YcgG
MMVPLGVLLVFPCSWVWNELRKYAAFERTVQCRRSRLIILQNLQILKCNWIFWSILRSETDSFRENDTVL